MPRYFDRLLGLIGQVSRRQNPQCPLPELTRSVSIQLNKRVSLPVLRETLILLAVVRDGRRPPIFRPHARLGVAACPAAAPPIAAPIPHHFAREPLTQLWRERRIGCHFSGS
jgi:hypothetical protein